MRLCKSLIFFKHKKTPCLINYYKYYVDTILKVYMMANVYLTTIKKFKPYLLYYV